MQVRNQYSSNNLGIEKLTFDNQYTIQLKTIIAGMILETLLLYQLKKSKLKRPKNRVKPEAKKNKQFPNAPPLAIKLK